jgi:anti-sigma B factor antagonist
VTPGEPRIDRRSVNGVDVIELHGEIDFASADNVRDALCATAAKVVVVDLGTVDFIDSAGLRALDASNRELRAAGRTLALVAPPASRAAFTFRVAGFSEDGVHDSVEAVLRSVTGS